MCFGALLLLLLLLSAFSRIIRDSLFTHTYETDTNIGACIQVNIAVLPLALLLACLCEYMHQHTHVRIHYMRMYQCCHLASIRWPPSDPSPSMTVVSIPCGQPIAHKHLRSREQQQPINRENTQKRNRGDHLRLYH